MMTEDWVFREVFAKVTGVHLHLETTGRFRPVVKWLHPPGIKEARWQVLLVGLLMLLLLLPFYWVLF